MYGLIGEKISHSFSADFFNKKFDKEGINEKYFLFPLSTIEDFPSLIETHPDLKGLNVTIPYKQTVIPYLDSLSDEAIEIGAVNVIKFIKNKDGRYLKGYNSDAIGFRESLLPLLKEDMDKALVLGTGGASKAVEYILKNLGLKVTLVSRTPGENQIGYEDINEEVMNENKLIVNTTPVGMFPNIENSPSIPYNLLSTNHLCYDLVYNPLETEFLKRAKENGASVKNGLEMLHLQALAAWDIWND